MKKLIFCGWLMATIAPVCVYASSPKVLIWDLGGVLVSNSKLTYVNSIGFKPIISYMVKEKTAPWRFSAHIQRRVFEVLQAVPIEEHCIAEGSCIPGGIVMPPVLWAFQAGLLTSEECVLRAEGVMLDLHSKGHFKNLAEKNLIERVIRAAFTPSLSVLSCNIRTETMKIVRSLAAQRHPDGTRKYKLFVLSNWDPWSFVHIRKKFFKELACFDDVIISGDIKLMKPMPEIFSHVLEKHKVSKEECIFIDDQLENIEGARTFGIKHPLHYTSSISLRRQLRRLKIL